MTLIDVIGSGAVADLRVGLRDEIGHSRQREEAKGLRFTPRADRSGDVGPGYLSSGMSYVS